ncbi:MAG: class I SAM-dependent methyltransferase [Pirellulales bacterium]
MKSKHQLIPFELEWDDASPLPQEQQNLISEAQILLQQFWDRWHQKPIEQYVACDFEYVARALFTLQERGLVDGSTFCEWGCGFGIVTGLASLLGWEAIGIEAEPFLVSEARKLLQRLQIPCEIWEGNFLPRGAERLADRQSNHASMFHRIPPAYESKDFDIDDFSIIFAYPWPGEEYFLESVFREYARPNAVLVIFRGPYHIEFYRKL